MNRFITIPPFVYPTTWLGAPYCIKKFEFASTFTISIPEAIVDPGVNFVAVLSWSTGGLTKQRYKLWQRTANMLYVDVYAQQSISTFFAIEIWTVFGDADVVNPADIVIPISKTELLTTYGAVLGTKYLDGVETVDMPQQLV